MFALLDQEKSTSGYQAGENIVRSPTRRTPGEQLLRMSDALNFTLRWQDELKAGRVTCLTGRKLKGEKWLIR